MAGLGPSGGGIVEDPVEETSDQVTQPGPRDDVDGPRVVVSARPDDGPGLVERAGQGLAQGRRQLEPAGPEGPESLGRDVPPGGERPEGGADRGPWIRDRRRAPAKADGRAATAQGDGTVAVAAEGTRAVAVGGGLGAESEQGGEPGDDLPGDPAGGLGADEV